MARKAVVRLSGSFHRGFDHTAIVALHLSASRNVSSRSFARYVSSPCNTNLEILLLFGGMLLSLCQMRLGSFQDFFREHRKHSRERR